jgi:PHP family Zn ribbon phosphoesterase
VELDKIIAESFGIKSRRSQKVQAEYNKIIKALGGEISILKDAPLEELAQVTTPRIVEGVRRVRDGDLVVEPGYDGEYGVVKIFGDQEKEKQQPLL